MENNTDVDRLFSSGVLVGEGEDVRLSAGFRSAVEDYESRMATFDRDALASTIREHVGTNVDVTPLTELGEKDPRSIAELCALSEDLRTESTTVLTLLPILWLFRTNTGPTDGVPGPFVPVAGDHLPQLSAVYSRLLVYVWLDDCPPCDSLKARLESIFDRRSGPLLFAVYGPDHKDILAQEYGVTGGPALLFMRDGAVDTRLYGDHDDRVIASEVERFLD